MARGEVLTGPPPQMSSGMSQLIGLKEKGLPQIARLLQSGNSDVVRSGASLLSNMSRHPALHRAMGKHPPLPRAAPSFLPLQMGLVRSPTFPSLLEGHPLPTPWPPCAEVHRVPSPELELKWSQGASWPGAAQREPSAPASC